MPTLCRAYATADEADAAVDRLMHAGLSDTEVQVLMSEAVADARDLPVGGFAGTTTPAADMVGAYAGAAHSARDAMGAFAGDGDEQRRGAFADVDRETVTTYAARVKRMRVASHHDLERMLVDAGLDRMTARADVRALHEGRVLVLVRSMLGAGEMAAAIDG